jgi:hypothetical protein
MPQAIRRTFLAAPLLLPAMAAALALGGCSTLSPTTTSNPRSYGVGLDTSVGSVQALGLVLVGERGKTGVLSGAFVNTGTKPELVLVRFDPQSEGTQVKVPAGTLVTVGGAASQVQLSTPALTQPAGTQEPILLSTSTGGNVQVSVPRTSATGDYAEVTPSPTPTKRPESAKPTKRPVPTATKPGSESAG